MLFFYSAFLYAADGSHPKAVPRRKRRAQKMFATFGTGLNLLPRSSALYILKEGNADMYPQIQERRYFIMKSIAFYNNKGGVGKTTSVINIAYQLATDKKILVVDMDGQANCSRSCSTF